MSAAPSRMILARRLLALALAVGLLGLAAACATGPVYRPRGPGELVGYTDTRLTENRYRVTFTGSTGTRREEVEDYLLRRAAEVTLENGYTHFVFDARDTSASTYYRSDFGPRTRVGIGFGRLGPRSWYWSSLAFGDPWYDGNIRPVTRFEAYSEIVMLMPADAARDPASIDARELLASLSDERPEPPPPPPL